MTRTAFTDCETTSLRYDRRAWEIAVIIREPGKPDDEHVWFVQADDLDLGNADLMSLKIGGFHERHPDCMGVVGGGIPVLAERQAMLRLERLTRGAHLVGAVPNFDADVYANRMREHGICPSWHYHLQDVETLAVGWLNGRRSRQNEIVDGWPLENDGEQAPGLVRWNSPGPWDVPLPWKSDELSRLCGVEPPGEDARHTALGDTRWARDLYDAITGTA